jgi:outer membrane protein OmpA-like peptidoglycan-associated protein
MLPANQKVVIEGHTDAVGTEPYNEELSQRRAQSVRRYLVATHGIEPTRLQAVGLGEHDPLPGRNPLAGENRRVQFRGQ